MATIYEVSKLAKVSLATVSRVMNDSERVAEKTRERVLAAMAELNYQPNSLAQSLASNRSNCVGVIVSELSGPIFGVMLSAIEMELRAAGKFAIFAAGHNNEAQEKASIKFLNSRNCDALILHTEALSDDFFIDQVNTLPPFVLLNRYVPEISQNCISLDNELGGYLATEALLKAGHRHIAYISGPLSWLDAKARFTGHKRALSDFDVKFDKHLFYEGDYREVTGNIATLALLARNNPMTALACANDEMAAGALDALRSNGRNIPEDISVVGFDNARWASFLYPKLTTVDYPVTEMSRMASHWVLRHVYGNQDLQIRNQFDPKLVSRASIQQHILSPSTDQRQKNKRSRT
jgi:LacI family transcriptional regulator